MFDSVELVYGCFDRIVICMNSRKFGKWHRWNGFKFEYQTDRHGTWIKWRHGYGNRNVVYKAKKIYNKKCGCGCRETFKSAAGYKNHRERETKRRMCGSHRGPHPCKACPKRFFTRKDRYEHERKGCVRVRDMKHRQALKMQSLKLKLIK